MTHAHPRASAVATAGVLAPASPDAILLTLPPNYEGPFAARLTIQVFHTLDPPGHHWPDTGHPETLWQRAFDVSYTAQQIEALR